MKALDKLRSSLESDPRVQQARDWYHAQAPRDQLIVRGVAILLALSLTFLILVLPLLQQNTQLSTTLNAKMSFYNTMADNAGRFAQGRGASAAASNTPLLALVSQQARKSGVTLTRYEQDGDSLRVWVDGAAFDEAITWMEELGRQFGVRATQVNIDRIGDAGRVNIRATFSK